MCAPWTTSRHLRRARKAAGLTQAELAARIGCGRHAVSYWETKKAPFGASRDLPRQIRSILDLEVFWSVEAAWAAPAEPVREECGARMQNGD